MTPQETKFTEIQLAKSILRENGYFVDNLWSVEDVQHKFVCDDETAQDVLYRALTNEATYEQIWLAIEYTAEDKQLNKQD
jgi:hypothetical protein